MRKFEEENVSLRLFVFVSGWMRYAKHEMEIMCLCFLAAAWGSAFFLEEMKINISFSSSSSLKIFLLLCFSTMNETTIVTATTTIIEWI